MSQTGGRWKEKKPIGTLDMGIFAALIVEVIHNKQVIKKGTTKVTKSHEMQDEEILLGEEVGMILDSAVEVHRVLGHGLNEKPYENALVREFELREIPFVQQPRYPVDYKQRRVGEFIPDLIVFDAIVVDTKTIDRIGDNEIAQMINYLRITKLRVGFIINFKHRRIETRRVIL